MATRQSMCVTLLETNTQSGDPIAMESLSRRFFQAEEWVKVFKNRITGQPLR